MENKSSPYRATFSAAPGTCVTIISGPGDTGQSFNFFPSAFTSVTTSTSTSNAPGNTSLVKLLACARRAAAPRVTATVAPPAPLPVPRPPVLPTRSRRPPPTLIAPRRLARARSVAALASDSLPSVSITTSSSSATSNPSSASSSASGPRTTNVVPQRSNVTISILSDSEWNTSDEDSAFQDAEDDDDDSMDSDDSDQPVVTEPRAKRPRRTTQDPVTWPSDAELRLLPANHGQAKCSICLENNIQVSYQPCACSIYCWTCVSTMKKARKSAKDPFKCARCRQAVERVALIRLEPIDTPT